MVLSAFVSCASRRRHLDVEMISYEPFTNPFSERGAPTGMLISDEQGLAGVLGTVKDVWLSISQHYPCMADEHSGPVKDSNLSHSPVSGRGG